MLGISAIVELLLITLLLIALVSLLWIFTSGTVNAIARSGTNQTQRTQEIFSTCMIVDSVHGNMIYLKNCGYGVITNDSLNVYMDDVPIKFNMTPKKTGKGEVGTIIINSTDLGGVSVGDHNLKITNPNSQTVQMVEVIKPDFSGSLVLDFEFDEGSGTVAYDSSGSGNNGTLYSGTDICSGGSCPNWVDGIAGKAISLDGVDDYIKIDSIPQFGPNPPDGNNAPFTITLWFKTSNVPQGENKYIFSDEWFEVGFILLDTGKLYASVYEGVESLQPITPDEWHFAALSYDYDNLLMSFYLDGKFQGSTPVNINGENGINDPPFCIGADYYGGTPAGLFNGTVDEVRIFNKSLSQDDINSMDKISLKMK